MLTRNYRIKKNNNAAAINSLIERQGSVNREHSKYEVNYSAIPKIQAQLAIARTLEKHRRGGNRKPVGPKTAAQAVFRDLWTNQGLWKETRVRLWKREWGRRFRVQGATGRIGGCKDSEAAS